MNYVEQIESYDPNLIFTLNDSRIKFFAIDL